MGAMTSSRIFEDNVSIQMAENSEARRRLNERVNTTPNYGSFAGHISSTGGTKHADNISQEHPRARRHTIFELSANSNETADRHSWSKVKFVLSIVSFAVGLGNIWYVN
jgi:hypothetical protein